MIRSFHGVLRTASLLVLCHVMVGCEGPVEKPRLVSQARAFAPKVKADLDVSRPEDLIGQIPVKHEMADAEDGFKVFKWRFGDGSALVGYFRPERSIRSNLTLYRMDFEE